ncbi:hypothetical protein C8R43DRAFT_982400 [Mycena crocata]|nr:hypothetical protein C8R43DRAFT_982400 [Mycena crocata]
MLPSPPQTMPFFENASNFTITGGNFNVISGDLNQYEQHYTTFTVNSHNNNPNDNPHHPSYYQYGSRPPRGTPPRPRAQHRHQEHGAYGYAEYYDNRGPASDANYGRYQNPGPHSRFETSLHSQEHVEIAGGEFSTQNGDFYQEAWGGSSMQGEDFVPTSSGTQPFSGHETRGELHDADSPAEENILIDEDAHPTSNVAVPEQRPLTNLEKMRERMANMELDPDQPEAGDADVPSAPGPSSEKKSSNKMFRMGRKS